jgi:hypothetical protein
MSFVTLSGVSSAPPTELTAKRCFSCAKELSKISRCAACAVAIYCGRECQRQDWKRHKIECQTLQNPTAVQTHEVATEIGVASSTSSVDNKENEASLADHKTTQIDLPQDLQSCGPRLTDLYVRLKGCCPKWQQYTAVRLQHKEVIWPEDRNILEGLMSELFRRNLLKNCRKGIAVDLGAGNGLDGTVLLGLTTFPGMNECNFKKVIAVDFQKGFAERMKKMSVLSGKIGSSFICLEEEISPDNAVQFPRNGTYDFYHAKRCLDYCDPVKIPSLLTAVFQSLKRGGQFFVTFQDLERITAKESEKLIWKNGRWGVPGLAKLMEGALTEIGFEVEHIFPLSKAVKPISNMAIIARKK